MPSGPRPGPVPRKRLERRRGTVVSGKPQAAPAGALDSPEVCCEANQRRRSPMSSARHHPAFLEMAYGLASTGMVPFYDKTNIEVFTPLTEGLGNPTRCSAPSRQACGRGRQRALRSMIVRMSMLIPRSGRRWASWRHRPVRGCRATAAPQALLAALQAPAPVVVIMT